MSPFEAIFGYQPATALRYGNPGDLGRYQENHHFELPLRWRKVHDRVTTHIGESMTENGLQDYNQKEDLFHLKLANW